MCIVLLLRTTKASQPISMTYTHVLHVRQVHHMRTKFLVCSTTVACKRDPLPHGGVIWLKWHRVHAVREQQSCGRAGEDDLWDAASPGVYCMCVGGGEEGRGGRGGYEEGGVDMRREGWIM